MVHFVGAGPGAPDLITQRGAALLQAADCIIYAGSLVNPALLGLARADCAIYNSAEMTLEQVAAVMKENEAAHKDTVRLHTGDPCLYGAIREQMDLLDEKYPKVAARVREHLETGWEPTLTLLEQAMGAGVIRRVSLPVLQRMISASIEDFLADRALDAQGISYTDRRTPSRASSRRTG